MGGDVSVKCRVLSRGRAEGEALVAPTTLSFRGEVDPMTGRILAKGHPLEGESVGGRVLVIESTRGSSATPLVLGLCARAGNAPVALVNTRVDALTVLGCLVRSIPMVVPLETDWLDLVRTGDRVRVDADRGILTLISRRFL